jgi:hypothetical protein
MKKIFLSTLICTICTVKVWAQFTFGPEGGLNFSDLNIKGPLSSVNTTTKAGFKLGITGDERLGDETNFHLQFSLLYSMKGASFPNDTKIVINYILIPFSLLYKFPTVNDDYFFIGLGPYAGFVNNGKLVSGGRSEKLIIGPKGDIEGVDIGVGLQAGYEFGFGLFFRTQYDLGTYNILPVNSSFNTSIVSSRMKNNAFSITTGWLFGKNRDRW